jgi:hypothetical protein
MFERLTIDAMEQPELRVEFPSMAERIRRRDELDARVQAWIGAFESDDVLARLDAASVPCSRVNSVRDLFADDHVRARENLLAVPGPDGEPVWMPGSSPSCPNPGRIERRTREKPARHSEDVYCGRSAHWRPAALSKKAVDERRSGRWCWWLSQAQNCSNIPRPGATRRDGDDFPRRCSSARIVRSRTQVSSGVLRRRLVARPHGDVRQGSPVRHGIRVVKMD